MARNEHWRALKIPDGQKEETCTNLFSILPTGDVYKKDVVIVHVNLKLMDKSTPD